MRSNSITSLILFLGLLLLVTGCGQPEPQDVDPIRRKSPIAIAKVNHEPSQTYVKIVYGQPYKRDREIFGNVVPYDEVWRTGANEATEITITNDILFAGEEVKAGTYTLFSIPRQSEDWTIILNSKLGQWGAFDYEDEHDVLRVKAPATQVQSTYEAFTIQFEEITNDSTNIVLRWDQTEVKIPIEFTGETSSANY